MRVGVLLAGLIRELDVPLHIQKVLLSPALVLAELGLEDDVRRRSYIGRRIEGFRVILADLSLYLELIPPFLLGNILGGLSGPLAFGFWLVVDHDSVFSLVTISVEDVLLCNLYLVE